MTDTSTLRKQIEALAVSARDEGDVMFNRAIYQVLDILDTQTEQPTDLQLSVPKVGSAPQDQTAVSPAPDAVAEARQPVFDILRSYDHPGEANYRKERLAFNFIDMAGEYRGQIAMTQDERDAVGGIIFALPKGATP